MSRKTLSIEHDPEQEQLFLKRIQFIVDRGGIVDEWITDLYRKGILKRYLLACNKGELYFSLEKMILEQDRKGEAQKVHESPKISGLVQSHIKSIITTSVVNDSDIWAGISSDTRRILEKYGIELTDISIPLSQIDNLTWIYNLEGIESDVFSRNDILEMIQTIPEILKIQF